METRPKDRTLVAVVDGSSHLPGLCVDRTPTQIRVMLFDRRNGLYQATFSSDSIQPITPELWHLHRNGFEAICRAYGIDEPAFAFSE